MPKFCENTCENTPHNVFLFATETRTPGIKTSEYRETCMTGQLSLPYDVPQELLAT